MFTISKSELNVTELVGTINYSTSTLKQLFYFIFLCRDQIPDADYLA